MTKTLPDAMSHTARDNPPPPDLKRLSIILAALIVLGLVGTTASIYAARATVGASKQDVARNRLILERVADLEAEAKDVRTEHRVRNEELHADLCRLVFEVVQAAPTLRDKGIRPCRPAVVTE